MTEERLLAIEAALNEDVSWRDQADRSELAWELLIALQQVRAGIAGLRREHTAITAPNGGYTWPSCATLWGGEECTCGADEWNAKVNALLKGDS